MLLLVFLLVLGHGLADVVDTQERRGNMTDQVTGGEDLGMVSLRSWQR